MEQKTCKDRVRQSYRERMSEVTKLWEMNKADPEKYDNDLGCWTEYGLCFDYVPRGTYTNQKRGFFRFQISTGGPGEEFRFYTDETLALVEIEFWFLDWFDGAKLDVNGKAFETWMEIWEDWNQMGVIQEQLKTA